MKLDTSELENLLAKQRDLHAKLRDKYNLIKQQNIEYKSIFDDLNNKIEGNEVLTSSWIPGSDWTNTVFQPIYEKACRQNAEAAGLFFGLIVWDVFLHHADSWSFGRYEKNNIPIKGLTYFRINR